MCTYTIGYNVYLKIMLRILLQTKDLKSKFIKFIDYIITSHDRLPDKLLNVKLLIIIY